MRLRGLLFLTLIGCVSTGCAMQPIGGPRQSALYGVIPSTPHAFQPWESKPEPTIVTVGVDADETSVPPVGSRLVGAFMAKKYFFEVASHVHVNNRDDAPVYQLVCSFHGDNRELGYVQDVEWVVFDPVTITPDQRDFKGAVVKVQSSAKPNSPSLVMVNIINGEAPPEMSELIVLDDNKRICRLVVQKLFHEDDNNDKPVNLIGCKAVDEDPVRPVMEGDRVGGPTAVPLAPRIAFTGPLLEIRRPCPTSMIGKEVGIDWPPISAPANNTDVIVFNRNGYVARLRIEWSLLGGNGGPLWSVATILHEPLGSLQNCIVVPAPESPKGR
ncbi:MAG: hypothetical protein IT462_07585 [Planctomycetes bacterium]|nr:hypothetical protein [Planctomycetota bacterium]